MRKFRSLIAMFLVLILTVFNLPVYAAGVNAEEAPGCEEGVHQWQEASCEAPKYCLMCWKPVGMPLGHDMGDWITIREATCTTDGELRMYCNRENCGYYEKEIVPKGHKYVEEVTEATCTQDGYTTYTCIECNHSYKESVVTAPGHKWQEASCTEPKYCPICGTFEGEILGHDMGDWVTLSEATCTADGQMRRTCSRCDYVEKEAIPANGHVYAVVVTEATCTQKGYTTYTCMVCKYSYADDYVDAFGHNWQKADCQDPKYCPTCGAFDGMALGHDMGDWVTISEATCTADGQMRRTCSRCDYVEKEAIPAEGHSWENGNCTMPKTCKTCGATSGEAKGHTYNDGLDGTCNTCGIHRETTEDRTVMHMFRMYDPNSGEHFYTGSVEERENLVAAGWNYEGVGFTFSRTTGLPVHRLYDPVSGEHLYTMQQPVKTGTQYEGKDLFECEGRIWLYEGIAFNSAYDTEVPQYRLRNPNATRGAYHFTSSAEERDNLIAAGWISEGICFYSSWK